MVFGELSGAAKDFGKVKKFSVTLAHYRTACHGRPPKFSGRPDAIEWAVAQGAFGIDEACQRFDALCKRYEGVNVYPFWIREVGRNL